MTTRRLLIVGNPEETHVGAHLAHAAAAIGQPLEFADSREAFSGPALVRVLNWRLRGRRPPRLRAFNAALLRTVQETGSTVVLSTGIAPVTAETIAALGRMGVRTMNFLTDDPWNPAHHAPWFLEALAGYDIVFSPRSANMPDLASLRPGRPDAYVPFGYSPDVHFPEVSDTERPRYEVDLMFAGGGDPDRVGVLTPFIKAGIGVGLYGGNWNRYQETRGLTRGHLDASGLRRATSMARLCLCLVRRANRDGHAMRSYEVPAMGGCILAEDTPDHRRMFGEDGDAAIYFTDPEEGVSKARTLLADRDRRTRMAERAHDLVTQGPNAYVDRLRSMLSAGMHAEA